ncbi:hypothetical protein F7725_002007 [Dissostichus mawsoni]|uniref:Uncharacterized protein n=1 Tax=Dissostichus mawsoni TaxID=36200 RepID=A0A7J5Y496_DISMA|nr:hypothetical protein F7725_002007 [Dissostichus mawsoni]
MGSENSSSRLFLAISCLSLGSRVIPSQMADSPLLLMSKNSRLQKRLTDEGSEANRGFQITKTDLVLVELGHTEVPLLLSHLRPSIQRLIHSCRFLTLLWWIEARLQAVEELIKAQLPVGVLIREFNEGINTQAPGKHR